MKHYHITVDPLILHGEDHGPTLLHNETTIGAAVDRFTECLQRDPDLKTVILSRFDQPSWLIHRIAVEPTLQLERDARDQERMIHREKCQRLSNTAWHMLYLGYGVGVLVTIIANQFLR